MTWLWIIAALIVLMALSALWRIFALFFFGFSVALGAMLLVHFQTNPAEASLALAGLGGTALLRRPLIRLLTSVV